MLRKHTHDLGVLNVQFGSTVLQSMLAGRETWRARLQYRVSWQTWRHGTNSCRPFPSKYCTRPCQTGPGKTERHQPTLQKCHPSGIILSYSPAIASPLLQDLIPSWLLGLRCHRTEMLVVLGKCVVSQSTLDFCRKGISVCNSINWQSPLRSLWDKDCHISGIWLLFITIAELFHSLLKVKANGKILHNSPALRGTDGKYSDCHCVRIKFYLPTGSPWRLHVLAERVWLVFRPIPCAEHPTTSQNNSPIFEAKI